MTEPQDLFWQTIGFPTHSTKLSLSFCANLTSLPGERGSHSHFRVSKMEHPVLSSRPLVDEVLLQNGRAKLSR